MKHAQKLKKFSPLQNLLRACVRKFEVHEINTYHVSRRAFCHRRRLCALQLKAMISAYATSTVAFCGHCALPRGQEQNIIMGCQLHKVRGKV